MGREIIKLRLRELLAQRGMTGRQLAELVGTTPQRISNILNNPADLSINALADIASALDVEFGDLFESSLTRADGAKAFSAVVRSPRGTFWASSPEELALAAGEAGGRRADAARLCMSTLERILRFPRPEDCGIASELAADLFLSLSPEEWGAYAHRLSQLLPRWFSLDRDRLSAFMKPEDAEAMASSLGL